MHLDRRGYSIHVHLVVEFDNDGTVVAPLDVRLDVGVLDEREKARRNEDEVDTRAIVGRTRRNLRIPTCTLISFHPQPHAKPLTSIHPLPLRPKPLAHIHQRAPMFD